MAVPALPVTSAFAARLRGSPFVLFLDIDGTLAPIASRPELAVVAVETKRVLDELSSFPGVYVVFVTGRAASDGRRIAGVDAAWVIGNHGMELARPGEPPRAREDVAPFEASVATAAARLARAVAEHSWDRVLVEDKRLTLSVHYRLADPNTVPELIDEVTRIGGDLG